MSAAGNRDEGAMSDLGCGAAADLPAAGMQPRWAGRDSLVTVARHRCDAMLEREAELSLIAQSVARATDGESALLIIEGTAGIGNTRLLKAARDHGGVAGLTTLHARASTAEHRFSLRCRAAAVRAP